MKLKFTIPLIAFLAVSILLGRGLFLNPKELPSALINKTAPEFNLELLTTPETPEQAYFSPSQMKGQRWILNVWASWCVSCRYEHPLLNQIAKETTIPLIGLNYKDAPDDARQWLQHRGNPYSMIPSDIEGNAGIDWGVYGVPETFVIDENGVIIYKFSGPINDNIFKTEILPLFVDKPKQTASTK